MITGAALLRRGAIFVNGETTAVAKEKRSGTNLSGLPRSVNKPPQIARENAEEMRKGSGDNSDQKI